MPIRRLRAPTLLVLLAFRDHPGHEWFGFELCHEVGLAPGTLYPILARLEQDGWITGRWGDSAGGDNGRHARRRFYVLSADGARRIAAELAGERATALRLRLQGTEG